MDSTTAKKQTMAGCAWILIPFGIWILISPFVLGYDGETAGMFSNIIVGGLLLLIGFVSQWVNPTLISLSVPVAAWLFISAFVLNLWGLSLLWSNVILTFSVMLGAGISEGLRLPYVGAAPALQTASPPHAP